MVTTYCLQLSLYTLCVNIFTLLTYTLYYINLVAPINNKFMEEYDYIIVGSGTAGSLIAHRIATETSFSHILLEAGGHSNFLFDIPVIGPLLQGSPYDWQFTTVKQDNACLAMNDQKCKLPQGKLVGGSAILNNMVHIRGNLTHYVQWFHGKYDINYFKKHFHYIESNMLHVEEINYESTLSNAILEAAKDMGFEIIDVNKNFTLGFMKSRVNQRNGQRWSTSRNFNKKINILNNAHVIKVLIDRNRIVYGVKVKLLGKIHEIYAKKGVILSAGAINTPKILMLSGIGTSETLRDIKVPVIKELPVGQNLQDHVTTGLDMILFNNSLNIAAFDIFNPVNVFKYFVHGKGPLTSPGCEVVGFLSTKHKIPDLQFMVLPVGIASDLGSHLRKTVGIKDEVWESYFAKTFSKYTATILPILLHPKSKGTVSLLDSNPDSPPLVNPKYLSNSEDADVLVKGLNIVKDFVNTKCMKQLGAELNPHVFPGCENLQIFTDEYWQCYIRHLTLTSFHPVGTCKMGLSTSIDSVVDTSFKVISINKLYIVDGSVLPALPSGNINAAIAMMANIFFDTNFINNRCNNISSKSNVCHSIDLLVCG